MTTTAVRKFRSRRNQRGLATVESIPLLVIFVMLVGYAVGMFGAIHTGILHSIAARTYAFETFRNRTNLKIFRENINSGGSNLFSFAKKGMRYHSVRAEDSPSGDGFFVTRRPLSIGYPSPEGSVKQSDHIQGIFTMQQRNQSIGVSPMWIMVGYGICLNAACGTP